MASTDKPVDTSGKTALESHPPDDKGPGVNLFPIDLILRVLLLASIVVAVVLLVTGQQTAFVLSKLLNIRQRNTAKFTISPALIYFLVALCVAGFYSIISILASFRAVCKKAPSKCLLLVLAFFDTVINGMVASAVGAAAAVSYVGYKGNSSVGWDKICNSFDKFCKHTAGYLAMALLASVILVLLLMLSTYSLYRRSR